VLLAGSSVSHIHFHICCCVRNLICVVPIVIDNLPVSSYSDTNELAISIVLIILSVAVVLMFLFFVLRLFHVKWKQYKAEEANEKAEKMSMEQQMAAQRASDAAATLGQPPGATDFVGSPMNQIRPLGSLNGDNGNGGGNGSAPTSPIPGMKSPKNGVVGFASPKQGKRKTANPGNAKPGNRRSATFQSSNDSPAAASSPIPPPQPDSPIDNHPTNPIINNNTFLSGPSSSSRSPTSAIASAVE
jgi:cbb3-type cytochrome oxidase subunit 3